MLRTRTAVSARFKKYLAGLQPRNSEMTKARKSVGGIKSRLSRTMAVSSVTWIGSHSKGTAIRLFSDVDLLVVFRREEVRWGSRRVSSDTLIKRVREQLNDRYPNTSVRKDGQAVVVQFGSGRHAIDVVPAVYKTQGPRNYPVYRIPDGTGGWLETAPQLDIKVFKERNQKARGQLARLVQLFKGWATARQSPIPIEGIHVERVLWKRGLGTGAVTYQEELIRAFSFLVEREGRALQDPLGVSGYIPLARTQAKTSAVLQALHHAYEHALFARDAQVRSDTDEAVRQWRIVFNYDFPSRLS